MVGALLRTPDAAARRAPRTRCCAARPVRQARKGGESLTLARPQAAGSRARARDRAATSPARRGDGGAAADRDRPHVAILRSSTREGLTILLIEHVMRAVMALANRVLCCTRRADRARAPRQVVREPAVLSSYLARRPCDADRRDPRCLLRRRAGTRRRLVRGRRGRDRRDCRRERRGQDLAHPHHRGHARPARGAISFAAPTSRVGRAIASAISASAGGRGPPGFPDAHCRGKSRHGRDASAREGASEPNRERVFALFPKLPERSRPPARSRAASSGCSRSGAA